MNNSYTGQNGGTQEVSEKTESRWRISTDVRNALTLFIGAVTLLAVVWGVCESSVSRLSDRFDQQDERFEQQAGWFELIDERFDRQDERFEQQARWFELIDERFDRQDERFEQQARWFELIDGRFDLLETDLDQIGRRLDRLESTTAEGFRQANDRMDRTDTRIDRLEAKVDKIESLLIEHRLRVPVEGD